MLLDSPTHFIVLFLSLYFYSLLLISIIMVITLDLCVCFALAECHLFLSSASQIDPFGMVWYLNSRTFSFVVLL